MPQEPTKAVSELQYPQFLLLSIRALRQSLDFESRESRPSAPDASLSALVLPRKSSG